MEATVVMRVGEDVDFSIMSIRHVREGMRDRHERTASEEIGGIEAT
jgi:hypothetical protein